MTTGTIRVPKHLQHLPQPNPLLNNPEDSTVPEHGDDPEIILTSDGELLDLEEVFGATGTLSKILSGYSPREQQITFSSSIQETMEEKGICVGEAATGTGKSLAYLIPAIERGLRGERTVISTATIALQNQLVTKDIPIALKAMGAEDTVKAVLMKGRSNFLCLMELNKVQEQNALFEYDEELKKILAWKEDIFCDGDKDNLGFVYEKWHELSATHESCLGKKCPAYANCYYYAARKEAEEAHLIVTNHHIVMADLALRNKYQKASLLPKYRHLVMDEAHHLAGVASDTLSVELHSFRMPYFSKKCRDAKYIEVPEHLLDELEAMNEYLFRSFSDSMNETKRKEGTFDALLIDDAMYNAKVKADRCIELLEAILQTIPASSAEPKEEHEFKTLENSCKRIVEDIYLLFSEDVLDDVVKWAVKEEARGKRKERIVLKMAYLQPGKLLHSMLWKPLEEKEGSATLVSATLATNGHFSFLRSQLGLPKCQEVIVESPFNFQENALLYVPGELPEPPKQFDADYLDKIAEKIMDLLALTQGRTFVLSTSWRNMNEIEMRLKGTTSFPLYVQGTKPIKDLIKAFKESGNGVLLGTSSFWEGIDVQGDALSSVVIDRIPFSVPSSPLEAARMQRIEAEKGKGASFTYYSVPQAQLKLKQGFGRLIRTSTDRGIITVLDSRLINKPYGKSFVNSLPPANRASVWSRVVRFWEGITPQ